MRLASAGAGLGGAKDGRGGVGRGVGGEGGLEGGGARGRGGEGGEDEGEGLEDETLHGRVRESKNEK